MSEVEIVYITPEEVRAKMEEIYERHPYLRDRVLTSDCYCCEYLDVQEEYGSAAGYAWQQLDTWKWLLNE